jgi:hypothetical protein
VVVVFGNLRGFTAFAAGTDPETIMPLLTMVHDASRPGRRQGAVPLEEPVTLAGGLSQRPRD